jgi:DNA ligase-1
MKFKPMLASDCGGIENVRFPVIASPKLDGVRALVIDGALMSRSLKPIPNVPRTGIV